MPSAPSAKHASALAERSLRPVLHRHAPARWQRPGADRADRRDLPGHAGGHDHGVRQRRRCGQCAQGRRLRLRLQAGRHPDAARPGPHRAAPRRGKAQRRRRGESGRLEQPPDRRLARHAAGARHDRQAGAQPGTGLHRRRIRRRQGAGGPAHPRAGPARQRPIRAGQLRRHSRRN